MKRATLALVLLLVACAGDKFVEQPLGKLPGYPKPENLIRFNTGQVSQFDFFVDRNSLSVGEDGVIRFTVVAKAPAASNVMYEGMRCPTRERRIYAFGQPDGTWRELADSGWERIPPPPVGLYGLTLYRQYFCAGGYPIRSAAEGVDALRRGGSPRALEIHEGLAD